jgi:hypothetical protein
MNKEVLMDDINLKVKNIINVNSNVNIKLLDSKDNVISEYYYHNLVVKVGIDQILARLRGERTDPFFIKYLALGSQSNPTEVSINDTDLYDNNAIKYLISTIYRDSNSIVCKYYLGSNEPESTYYEAGLFSNILNSSSSTLTSRVVFEEPIEKILGQTIVFTWEISIGNA